MNQCFINDQCDTCVTPHKLLQAKHTMLEMLSDLDKICKENNLTYFLAYGTCLGAIRHKGFIPWDDDIDVGMPRDSFNTFCQIIDKDYKQCYDITSPILSPKKQYLPFAKIYKKNTLYLEKGKDKNPFPKGIFIDIFPFDYLPSSKVLYKVYSQIFKLICIVISRKHLEWNHTSDSINKFKKKHIILFYGSGILTKLITLFLPINVLYDLRNKLSTSVKKSKYTSCYHSDKPYKVSDIFPVSVAQFEGRIFPVPHNVHNYLTICFDEHYMQLPPIEKRCSHDIIKIRL